MLCVLHTCHFFSFTLKVSIEFLSIQYISFGFPGGSVASLQAHHLQCRRCGFDPWVGMISSRRKWQPIPVLLPGGAYGQRGLMGYSPWGHKERHRAGQQQCFILYYIILYIKLTNSVLKMKSIFLPLQFYDSFLLKEVTNYGWHLTQVWDVVVHFWIFKIFLIVNTAVVNNSQ